MTTSLATLELISEEDFLDGEHRSDEKYEYLAGMVYAMAGASEAHNIIAVNLYGGLHGRLRGKSCQTFGSDMKLRLKQMGNVYYYYPDAMISCDPTDSGHGWRERPSVLFEITSKETQRIDILEKRVAYQQIASLDAYVRIEQGLPIVEVARRTANGWETETLNGLGEVIRLPSVSIELPLAELYERLSFGAAK